MTRGRESSSGAAALIDDPDGPVELARDLVAAASPNPPGDERAVADVLVRTLRGLGIDDIQVVGAAPERPNVIARIAGRGGGPHPDPERSHRHQAGGRDRGVGDPTM